MIPTQKLLDRLKQITQLAEQAHQGIVSNVEVQKSHPERLANAERWLQLAGEELKLIREEDEVGVGYWEEVSDALPMIIDRLNNQMVIQQNLDFIMATDKEVVGRFIKFVTLYGLPLLEEVLTNMSDEEFAQIEDVIDVARRGR